jgi:hypothetical protein
MKEKKLALGFEPETFEVQFDIDTKVRRRCLFFLDNWKFCFGHSKRPSIAYLIYLFLKTLKFCFRKIAIL